MVRLNDRHQQVCLDPNGGRKQMRQVVCEGLDSLNIRYGSFLMDQIQSMVLIKSLIILHGFHFPIWLRSEC
jgi:hypothetical protein